jgi:two-component system response regulator AtoC
MVRRSGTVPFLMALQHTLLIVDDEKNTRDGLRRSLEEGFDVYVASSAEAAWEILERDTIDLLLTDLRLAGEDGMQLIDRALRMQRPPICIMMTAYGSVDTAVEAMKRGAYDFVTKPVNIDNLEILIRRALRSREVEKENVELRQQVERRYGLDNIIGESAPMQEVFDVIRQVAPTRATVLIEGESGTGKELVAHAIHNLSPRSRQKFVAVHCRAFNAQLLESELFGHERGSFTGAYERRIGRFEDANGGTLFLDEIGEIDEGTQVKLLRVLGERTFERVGGNQPIKTDVRLVAATNKNLETLVEQGRFRDDLFFRINVVRITLPPLRERKEDIPLLAAAFLKEAAAENGKKVTEFTSEVMNSFAEYEWPGNVRELRTAVEHGVVMARGPKVTLRDLPASVRQGSKPFSGNLGTSPRRTAAPVPDHLNLQETEKRLILDALEACKGNRTKAAQRLGISRRTLHRKLKELQNPEPENRNDAEH